MLDCNFLYNNVYICASEELFPQRMGMCVCVCVALSSEGVYVSESERPVKLFRLRKPLSR